MADTNYFKEQDIEFARLPDPDTRFGSEVFRDVKELQVGDGANVFRADRSGIWLGAAAFADAPFSVDMQGNVIASNITLGGYIPTGGAAADVNANSGTVNANKINASQLSAISADLGTITAGSISAVTISGSTITGSTLTTGSSGQRVVLTTTLAQYYNSSNTQVGTTYGDTSGFILSADSGILRLNGTSSVIVTLGGVSAYAVFDLSAGTLRPNANGTLSLGQSGSAWSNIYAIGFIRYQAINQPVNYHGYVSGTTISKTNDLTWSAANGSTGNYTITHNFGTTNYTVQLTTLRASGTGVRLAKVGTLSSNSFTVIVHDETGTLQNGDFMYLVSLGT